MSQFQRIHGDDWDYLVILDACRYDTFQLIHGEYLDGEVSVTRSPVNPRYGYATTDWLCRVFPNQYDVTYISATPRVNSVVDIDGYDARDHFEDIVDVWSHGWDDTYGTVRPETVTENALEARGHRVIVHYLQPHEPFLSCDPPARKRGNDPSTRSGVRYRFQSVLGGSLLRYLGHARSMRVFDCLGLPQVNHIHEVAYHESDSALRDYYEANLRAVLESVTELVESVPGRVVVTSNHGEFLGENGYYGHSFVPRGPMVTRVPWFVATP